MSNSLSETFSKVNHARHILMDVAMLSAAIGLVVSTGGAAGFFDPVGIFLNMHVPAMSDLAAIGDFFNGALDNAGNGTWMTDMAFMDAHGAHAGHSAHAMLPIGEPVISESFMDIMGGP
ncbi:MAG: hypothetical protein CMH27_01625 [Micavibrio sp.]|nr:hypothetical protein [Micavibrio sp.]|tara:strand:- start:722 stop:1078 length:357 start_codon:yes stop_codon:yes gene_type:complete